MITYFIGLDLGREQDCSALATLERRRSYWCAGLGKYVPHYETDSCDYDDREEKLGLVGLSRVPLRRSWGEIAKELDGLIERCFRKEKDSSVQVWVNTSRIGSPIIKEFFEPVVLKYKNCSMDPVEIVLGTKEYSYKTETVSEIYLIDNVRVMKEKGEYVVVRDLQGKPIMQSFKKQYQDFGRKEGKRTGMLRYEVIEGELVIAFALACLGVKRPELRIDIIDMGDDEEDFRSRPGLSDELPPWRPLSD